jgi:HK97 family phage prohead protease
MKTKLSSNSESKVSFYSRKNNTRSIFVEGFANRYKEDDELLVDRGNDLIEPKAWDLKNFSSNGIILFNHDRDQPIGRAVKVEKTDDGLFIKAKLSDSTHPEVSRIRDLVKDGVLRTFSVGFNPKVQEEEDVNGKSVNVIKEAELLEVSIVSLPMAERSLFNVTAKQLSEVPYEMAKSACLGDFKLVDDDGAFTKEVLETIGKAEEEESEEEETEEADSPEEGSEKAPDVDQAAEVVDSQPAKEDASSPLLDAIRQTNVLLSNLISETKLMSQKLDSKVEEEVEEQSEETRRQEDEPEDDQATPPTPVHGRNEADEEEEEDEESKAMQSRLKVIDDIHADCDRILRKYGY